MGNRRPGLVPALPAALFVVAVAGATRAQVAPADAAQPPSPSPTPTAAAAAAGAGTGVAVAPLRHLDARAAALLMSGRQGGNLDAALAVGVPEGVADGRRLPYWIEVRGTAIAPAGAAGTRELQAFAYVLDERGEVVAFSGLGVRLDLDVCGERLRASGARLHGTVALPTTARTLRVLLRDTMSGTFMLDEAPLTPFAADADEPAGIVLLPPAPTEWLEARMPEPAGAGTTVDTVPVAAAPAARPVVASPGRARFELVGNAALGRVDTVHGRVVDARGIVTSVASLEVVERTEPADGQARLTVDWPVPSIAPGHYVLEVFAGGGDDDHPVAQARFVAWPAADLGAVSSWAVLPAAEPSAPEPGLETLAPAAVADASELRTRYLDALRRLAAGEEAAALAAVVALERGALAPGSAWFPARLARLELGVTRALTRANPDAVVPLLVLHGEVARDRLAAGDTAGTQQALTVAVELIRLRSIDDAEPATRTAAAEAAAALADTFFALGAPSDTRALLERARALAPDSVPVAIGLAAACEVAGDYWRVVATLGPLLERLATPIELRLRLGVNLRRVNRPDPAATALTACAAPGNPTWVRVLATEELALLEVDRDRLAQAAAVLEQGLAALPDEQSLAVLLAYVSEQDGRVARARRLLQQLDRLAASGPAESPRLRYARWSSEQLRGERERARHAARERLPALAAALAQLDAEGDG